MVAFMEQISKGFKTMAIKRKSMLGRQQNFLSSALQTFPALPVTACIVKLQN